MAADFSQLVTEVERNKSVDDSAIALLNGFSTRLEAAIAQAVKDNDDADLTAITDFAASFKSSNEALAAAVAANTPAAEEPPAEPPV